MDRQDTRIIVGMDAHSEKIQLYISHWRGIAESQPGRSICTTLESLEATYRKQVPAGATTVLEASTNSFSIVRRLKAIGYEAIVAKAETVAGMSRGDHINDAIDAVNLARAQALGLAQRVFVPTGNYQDYRFILHAYCNAKGDVTRLSNRIWALCSGRGRKLPPRGNTAKAATIRKIAEEAGIAGLERMVLDRALASYEVALKEAQAWGNQIELIVAGDRDMSRLTQVCGVRFVTAFALVAYIEDIRRFDTAARLVAYVGLNPVVCESGKSDSPRRLSKFGQPYLKSLLVECATSALSHGKEPMHAWARRLAARGKPVQVVRCALARKMLVQAWHVLMGHPAPGREAEKGFRGKMIRLATAIGKEEVQARGFASREDFADAAVAPVYAHLPPRDASPKDAPVKDRSPKKTESAQDAPPCGARKARPAKGRTRTSQTVSA